MGVDDEVRHGSIPREWHVLRVDESPDDALLTVTTCEFVTDLRDLLAPHHRSNEAAAVQTLGHEHVVDPSDLSVSDDHGRLTPLLCLEEGPLTGLLEEPGGTGLPNEDVPTLECCLRDREAISLQMCVCLRWTSPLTSVGPYRPGTSISSIWPPGNRLRSAL